MKTFHVVWEYTGEGEEPLDAVLQAEEIMAVQIEAGKVGVGGGVFNWIDADSKDAGVIDLEELRAEGFEQRLRRWI